MSRKMELSVLIGIGFVGGAFILQFLLHLWDGVQILIYTGYIFSFFLYALTGEVMSVFLSQMVELLRLFQ